MLMDYKQDYRTYQQSTNSPVQMQSWIISGILMLANSKTEDTNKSLYIFPQELLPQDYLCCLALGI